MLPMATVAEGNETKDLPIVKIGFLNPITGPIAVYAPGWTAAADIAEEHINAMQSQYTFEIVEADPACDGTTAASAAQVLVNDGVVAVAGAACTVASMGANSVLSTYGIPQVSYASTNPGLSDDSAYPGFMRVVPSDAQQGQALSHAFNQTGDSNPALVHEDSNYGSGLADAFTDAYGSSNICSTMSYDWTHTESDDFSDEVYSLVGDGCDSVVMVSYSVDGAALVEELRDWGFSGSIVGGDGIADGSWTNEFDYPSEANGVHAVKPTSQVPQTNLQTAFDYECNQDSDCSSGIYTREAYDAIRLIADAYINSSSYSSLEQAILGTGTNWEGASGYVTFLPNGDAVGNGYDICEFVSENLVCNEVWTLGSSDYDEDGWTDADELDCSTDPYDPNSVPDDWDSDGLCDQVDTDDDNDGFSDVDEITNCGESNDPLNPLDAPTDTDGDLSCDALDADDDNDGYLDANDWAPTDPNEWLDTDGDGTGDNADFDDDGDSWADIREVECGYDPLSASSTPPDFDSDNECDEIDYDDDNDGYLDTDDWAPLDSSEWIDTDDDGIGDNADQDDDNDGFADEVDWAPMDSSEWVDTDNDGVGNNADSDDDDDGYSDLDEITNCGSSSDPLDESSSPEDFDSDLICDLLDDDDDNDGYLDSVDFFPYDYNEWYDNDGDGLGDNADLDDDNDLLSDIAELSIGTDPFNRDTDGDGYLDSVDDLPLDSSEWRDSDGDGTGDNSDAFPSIARYQTTGGLMLDFVFIVVVIVCLGLLVTRFRMLNRSQTGSLIEASWEDVHTAEVSEDPMPPPPPGIDIPSESQKVSSWEGLPTVGEYIQTEPMQYIDEEGEIWVRQQDDSWVRQ